LFSSKRERSGVVACIYSSRDEKEKKVFNSKIIESKIRLWGRRARGCLRASRVGGLRGKNTALVLDIFHLSVDASAKEGMAGVDPGREIIAVSAVEAYPPHVVVFAFFDRVADSGGTEGRAVGDASVYL
jgi:hypothetical protein